MLRSMFRFFILAMAVGVLLASILGFFLVGERFAHGLYMWYKFYWEVGRFVFLNLNTICVYLLFSGILFLLRFLILQKEDKVLIKLAKASTLINVISWVLLGAMAALPFYSFDWR